MNERLEERFTSMAAAAVEELAENMQDGLPEIHIGMATCCLAAGAAETKAAFEEALVESRSESGSRPSKSADPPAGVCRSSSSTHPLTSNLLFKRAT
jgi:hypothetical protein